MKFLDEIYALWRDTIFLIFDIPPNQLADNFINKISFKVTELLWPENAPGMFVTGNLQETINVTLAIKTIVLILEALVLIFIFKKIWKTICQHRQK